MPTDAWHWLASFWLVSWCDFRSLIYHFTKLCDTPDSRVDVQVRLTFKIWRELTFSSVSNCVACSRYHALTNIQGCHNEPLILLSRFLSPRVRCTSSSQRFPCKIESLILLTVIRDIHPFCLRSKMWYRSFLPERQPCCLPFNKVGNEWLEMFIFCYGSIIW